MSGTEPIRVKAASGHDCFTSVSRRGMLPVLAVCLVLGASVLSGEAVAQAPLAGRPVGALVSAPALSDDAVNEDRYDLGDQAFAPPPSLGYDGRSEVAATVYRPARVGTGRLPLIVMQHGLWETCADADAAADRERATEARDRAEQAGDEAEAERQSALIERAAAKLWAWPCTKSTEQIPSNTGYDYLGRRLAAQGFVVVSVGANGINATSGGQAPTVYHARALLIEHHLRLWKQWATRGDGPLAHALVDAETGRPDPVDFRGRLDLDRVGLLGHSMGGGGVMQEVSDTNRRNWPNGVRIRAAFTLAPTATWDGDPVTQVPFAVMWGTCDMVNTGSYFEQNHATTRAPAFKYTLTGANHDFYNRQWSPSSGQVASRDDAVTGTAPETCRSQYEGNDPPHEDQPRMPETRQRLITANRVSAFFQRFLHGRTECDAYLTGARSFPSETGPQRVFVDYVPGADAAAQ
ncbi:alpha/beta hydrolase [Streptomyces griseorubiginosus]|uniref:alpha/beta hydrolase n=1 Tax=Streptomyces griseorubiginosus TaxID=67304 RepID=UPI001140900F|nr:alpha/beta hydrolase [Streptomyces griseorubiginosus]